MAGSVINDPRAWTHEGSSEFIRQILNVRRYPGLPQGVEVSYTDIDFTNDGTPPVGLVIEDMNVTGTAGTPVVFTYTPTAPIEFIGHVTMFIEHKGKMDADRFGAIAAIVARQGLVNGWQLQSRTNGVFIEILNARNNMEIIQSFNDGAGTTPTSTGLFDTDDAFTGKYLFSEPICLITARGDFLRWTVRDDLSLLDFLRARLRRWVFL